MSEKKQFYKQLFALVLPIAFQNFMNAAVSASDALMLGVLNQESLSAVSLASQISFVQQLFLVALTIGTTILAAQYWGKGDRRAVSRIFSHVLRISVTISMVFFLTTLFFPEFLMKIFTPEQPLIEKGCEYLRVVGISYLLSGISQIYLCILKNTGKTLQSTFIGSFAMVLNIVLNAVFIYGIGPVPSLGITGAALATVISRFVELSWALADSSVSERIRPEISSLLHPDKLLAGDFWKYTLPVLGNELAWGIGFTMYSVIMGHLGNDAVAANSIATIVKNIIACVCLGIGSGGGILVGNELGKGALEQAKAYGDRLFSLCIAAGVVSAIVLLACSPIIVHYANLSPTAHHYLQGMLYLCSYYMVGKSINATVIAGIFCAGGDSRFGLICDTVNMWCFIVPAAAAAAFVLHLPVLWVFAIINLDEVSKLPAVIHHYRKYQWVKDLTRQTSP